MAKRQEAVKPQTRNTEIPQEIRDRLAKNRERIGLRSTPFPVGEYEIEVVGIEVVPSKPKVNAKGELVQPSKPDWLALTYTDVETGEMAKGCVPASCDRDFRSAKAGDRFYVLNEGKKLLDGEQAARIVMTVVASESDGN